MVSTRSSIRQALSGAGRWLASIPEKAAALKAAALRLNLRAAGDVSHGKCAPRALPALFSKRCGSIAFTFRGWETL